MVGWMCGVAGRWGGVLRCREVHRMGVRGWREVQGAGVHPMSTYIQSSINTAHLINASERRRATAETLPAHAKVQMQSVVTSTTTWL